MLYVKTTHEECQIPTDKHFPDNTLSAKFPVLVLDSYLNIYWKYENDAEVFYLRCAVDYYRRIGFTDIILTCPYLPNARMDRVEYISDVFTLKTLCTMINEMNFNSVVIFDVHSNVSAALLNNVDVMKADSFISSAIRKIYPNKMSRDIDDFIICYPDLGASKRYQNFSIINFNSVTCYKTRDWKTAEITLKLLESEKVKDKNVLIVDDICSLGTTFYYTAKALKDAGANKVYLYVSHAENKMVEGQAYAEDGLIEKIFTTDSIFNKSLDELNKVEFVHKFF